MKWTQDIRRIVYARLVMEFGPYSEWKLKQRPEQDEARYDAVVEELARYLKSITGEDFAASAVKAQVNWGCTEQATVKDQSHARNFVLNKAAALETGFIAASDLPQHMDIGAA